MTKKYVQWIYKAIVFTAILTIIAWSCKKDSPDNPESSEVKYEIVVTDEFVLSIVYNDDTQKEISTDDISQFPNGIKKITVNKKPFTAKLGIKVLNTTNQTKTYSLTISVNGVIKKQGTLTAPAQVESQTSITYTLN
ncbi:MAG: hypothetical protein J5I50_08430 [Chitinophagaceae bacterium]|nr:hypothetical protein [Chitinophagaceae bacterium]